MDVLGWLWWLVTTLVGWVLSLVWLLVGGWVSTLLQILVVIGLVLSWKYGWRRAPAEAWQRLSHYWPRIRGWLGRNQASAGRAGTAATPAARRDRRSAETPRRKWSAVRISSWLTAIMLIGLGLLALLPTR